MALPDLQALSDAGGYVVAVATLIAVVGLIITGRLVPGHIYDREVRRGDSLDATLDKVIDTLEDLTEHVAGDQPGRRRGPR